MGIAVPVAPARSEDIVATEQASLTRYIQRIISAGTGDDRMIKPKQLEFEFPVSAGVTNDMLIAATARVHNIVDAVTGVNVISIEGNTARIEVILA